jgi:hypothetical protein
MGLRIAGRLDSDNGGHVDRNPSGTIIGQIGLEIEKSDRVFTEYPKRIPLRNLEIS